MSLTPTQKEWADAQVGTEIEVILDGTITKKSGRKGDYTMEVTGDDGVATFFLDTEDAELADKHVGVESSVKIEGKVASVTLDEEDGRVGLVVVADNGTVTQWHVPERSDKEIEAARPPEPTAEEIAAREKTEADTLADAEATEQIRCRDELVSLLKDPQVKAAVRNAAQAPS